MPKTRTRTASPRGRSGRGTGAVEVFRRPGTGMVRDIASGLIRLRAEFFVLSVLVVSWYELHSHLTPWATDLVLFGTAGLVTAVPVSRRFVVRRVWCVVSRHRMRACMVQIRSMMNYSGWLPWMVWAHPTPVGERLVMWLRPGISIDDLEDRTEHIAVSCWARDARVRRSRRLAALVIVDVMRRDPLTGRKSDVDSPLSTVGADGPTPPPAAITPAAQRHLRPVPTDGPAQDTTKRTIKKAPTGRDAPGVVVNGEDISDYL